MNGMLGYSDSQLKNSQMAVRFLLNKASPPRVPPPVAVPVGEEPTGGTPEGGLAPPAPPAAPAAPPESVSPFEALPDKSAKPDAGQAPPKATGSPAGAVQPGQELVPKTAAANGTPAQTPVSPEKPALPPLGDGPLSGVWQTLTGARFRISDDKKLITVDGMQSTALQSFTGKLTRTDGNPEAKLLKGTFNALFTIDSRPYTIEVTMTILDPNTLSIRCTDWPKWDNKGKFRDRGVLNITWLRSPDEGHDSPGNPFAPGP
jgi:hypothetical protein